MRYRPLNPSDQQEIEGHNMIGHGDGEDSPVTSRHEIFRMANVVLTPIARQHAKWLKGM